MKIEKEKRYRVLITFHKFMDSDSDKFILLPGEEYQVDFVYERGNDTFVNLVDGSEENRELSVRLDTFKHIFDLSK